MLGKNMGEGSEADKKEYLPKSKSHIYILI
jgi:hypothetical protein